MTSAKDIEFIFLSRFYLDLDFTEETSEFECIRCGRVMIQHYVINCGHRVCHQCRAVLGDGVEGRKCPQCTRIITKIADNDDLEFKKKVLSLQCVCPHKRNGCQYKDTLRNIVVHFENCKHLKGNQQAIVNSANGTDQVKLKQDLMADEINNLKEKVEKLNSSLKIAKDHAISDLKSLPLNTSENGETSNGALGEKCNVEEQKADVQKADVQKADVQKADVQKADVQKADVQKADDTNDQSESEKEKGVSHYKRIEKSVSNEFKRLRRRI